MREYTVFASNGACTARWSLLVTLVASVLSTDHTVVGIGRYLYMALLAGVAAISRLGVTDSVFGAKPRPDCAPGCVLGSHGVHSHSLGRKIDGKAHIVTVEKGYHQI